MMVAVILGALSLGACVDNNESASVEGVRNAKAAQLNSVAAMNNAEAEAKKAITAAEVALKEAKAAFKKAKAEAAQAEADEAKIALQKAQAGLEAKLEANKIKAEAELANAKAQLEGAKALLIAAMDKVDVATKNRITDLLAKADIVLRSIDTNRPSLITAKFNKAKLEAGLVNVKDLQAQTIASEKRKIAKSEALIAEYGKYSQATKEEALKAGYEAEAKAEGFWEVYVTANNAFTSATAKVATAERNVSYSAYLANATSRKSEYVAGYSVNFANADGTNNSVYVQAYTKNTADTEQMNATVTTATRELAILKSKLKDAEKALTDKKTSESYKASEKAVVDAKKALGEATTTAEKEAATAALNNAEQNLKYAAWTEEVEVKTATTNVKNQENNLKVATDKLAAVSGDNATAYAALVKAWEDAMAASTAAQIESLKAYHNYDVQRILASSLNQIANNLVDYAALIQSEKTAISTANEKIAGESTVATKEEAIAKEDRNIAKLEQQLAIDEATYADYLAQIKALVEAGK